MSIMIRESEAHRKYEHLRPTLGIAPKTSDTPESRSFEEFRKKKKQTGIDKSEELFK